MNFDADRLMTRLISAARAEIERLIVDSVTALRCSAHPESRVTVNWKNGKALLSGPACCPAFERQLSQALYELGATPMMEENQPTAAHQRQPLAFMSHSSADKERIARPLDTLLREHGIGVWLDERDLLPGRNLVDEIFSHGISRSDVFVVILSENSINSGWVHEELTNAAVQKIDGVVKAIIPIILDGVTPPDFLKQTVWETINDLNRLPMHADRVAAAIIGRQPAPIAPLPAYAGTPVYQLPSLTNVDEQIFVAACRQILDNTDFYSPIVSFPQLFDFGQRVGLSEEQVAESLAALEQHRYLTQVIHGFGEMHPAGGRISDYGMEQYLRHYMPDEYRSAKLAVLSDIVNRNGHSSRPMARSLGIHEAIVEHILMNLEYGGHVIASHHSQGVTIRPNPTIARLLRDLESGK